MLLLLMAKLSKRGSLVAERVLTQGRTHGTTKLLTLPECESRSKHLSGARGMLWGWWRRYAMGKALLMLLLEGGVRLLQREG